MVAQNSGRIDQILAQSQALRGQLSQRYAQQDQILQSLPAIQPQTNFLSDFGTELVDQASFNTLDRPSGGGVGSTLGRAAGGLANAATLVGLLGLTPIAPEVTIPTGLGLAGFLGGGSMEARTQYNQSGQITDPGAVFGQGLIEGGLNLIPGSKAASFGRRLLTDVPVQTLAGVAGDAGSQLMRGQPYNFGETGQAAAMGGGMGVLSALLGGHAPRNLPEPQPQALPRELPTQRVAGLLPEPAATDRGFTGTPNDPTMLPGTPRLLTGGPAPEPLAQAQQLLTGRDTPLLTGRRVVTTADGRSTFELEPSNQPGAPTPQRLAGDGGVLLRGNSPDIVDAEFRPVAPDGQVHQGEVVNSPVLKPNEQGYIDAGSVNSPVEQTFKNRSSAMRGARNLGLDTAEVQPVQTGPGQWMIHKIETPKPVPAAGETPNIQPEDVALAQAAAQPDIQPTALPVQPLETPAVAPAAPPDVAVPSQAAQPAALSKPPTVLKALEGLDPKEQKTVHDFDLSTVEPGSKVDGLGTFKGLDEDGLPIISRKGGLKRPGESGFAYDEQSLPTVLKQAGDVLQPGDDQMLQQIMQDVQTGQATQFVGRAKQGNSANMAASADSPGTMAAYGAQKNDRVIGVYYKPATLTAKGEVKTPAQVVARVVNNLGEQSTRIIREAGNPDVGYMRTGSAPQVPMHSPATVATAKRALATDAQLQQAAIVRKAAIGTKHANHPIVQRIDAAIQSNNVKDLQQALRDFDRLPPELQKKLNVQSGCIK